MYSGDSDSDSSTSSHGYPKGPKPEKVVPKYPVLLPIQEEIHDKLKKMGVKHPKTANFCVKAAIAKGYIKITGDPSEMDMVVHEEEGKCGHLIKATLRDLLKQPNCADGLGEMEDATVLCSYKKPGKTMCGHNRESDRGRTYVAYMCIGQPAFDTYGKNVNHCTRCDWFGQCMGDTRMTHCLYCNDHYYRGLGGIFSCQCMDSDYSASDYPSQSSGSECSDHDECKEEIKWKRGCEPYFMKARKEYYKAQADRMQQASSAKKDAELKIAGDNTVTENEEGA